VNGRNGKAIRDEHVQARIDGAKDWTLDLPTNPDGVAELQAPPGSMVYIMSDLYVDCRPFKKGIKHPWYSMDEIVAHGLATENNCGKVRREAQPGELIFFVRLFHWWERWML